MKFLEKLGILSQPGFCPPPVIDKSLDLEKSREEMPPYFLACSRKLNFHLNFYSRFLRFLGQNLFLFSVLGLSDFSFSSRNYRVLKKSLSPLETGEKKIPFSFSSRKLRTFFQISLSPLETGERNFRFLFLFSKLEKGISNFSFSSRLDFLASRQWLPYII